MNKEEFTTYLENVLESSYLNFYDKALAYSKSCGKFDTLGAEKEALRLWKDESGTLYATMRAEVLNHNCSWEDYIEDFEVLSQIESALEDVDFSYLLENEHTRNKYDERGYRVTTTEGFTGYLSEDIKEYFFETYLKQDWKVLPGHWPTMENKDDVDNWIETMNSFFDRVDKKRKQN
jgi:hypothetical protein